MSTIELERELQAEERLSAELEQYAGQWVAVRQHSVVAHADALPELLEQIQEQEVEAEGIFQVPAGGYACFF